MSKAVLDNAFAALARHPVDAILVMASQIMAGWRDQLVEVAARTPLSAMYFDRSFLEAGGVISYGPDVADTYRQAGLYAGRILKGEKPSDLPVVLEDRFELLINLKTARALGIEVPPPLLLTGADEVIE